MLCIRRQTQLETGYDAIDEHDKGSSGTDDEHDEDSSGTDNDGDYGSGVFVGRALPRGVL